MLAQLLQLCQSGASLKHPVHKLTSAAVILPFSIFPSAMNLQSFSSKLFLVAYAVKTFIELTTVTFQPEARECGSKGVRPIFCSQHFRTFCSGVLGLILNCSSAPSCGKRRRKINLCTWASTAVRPFGLLLAACLTGVASPQANMIIPEISP